ncbi:MAG: FeoB small GTPase domain-containing protein, partial [Pseudohongiellaceae bacterium]
MKKIALIGNPNCGKTTLFNLLTGARQKVGNWPGVTVEKKFGYCMLEGQQAELIDLPGIYSLEQEYQGVDEQISCDFLANNEAQLIINLIDASNLERGLVLTQQLSELGVPIIVVLNMLDVAEQHGIAVDPQKLAEQ